MKYIREALVITEKFSVLPNFWKLPGGAVDLDEDLSVAAEREVLEETGAKATFESLVAFRHMHQYRFGRADVYHVCVLRATAAEGSETLIPQAEEIAAVRWAPLDEIFAFPHLRFWLPHLQPTVEHEVRRIFQDPSLPCAGIRPVKMRKVTGPGTSSLFVSGMSSDWYEQHKNVVLP
jgi:ADP-ribose pyrophosphatase YjhB (NUDIX family)